jgi:hypothetical protein
MLVIVIFSSSKINHCGALLYALILRLHVQDSLYVLNTCDSFFYIFHQSVIIFLYYYVSFEPINRECQIRLRLAES